VEPDLGLFVVADGMGGAQAGERASAIAIETIVRGVRQAAPRRSAETLIEAIRDANRAIISQASENPDYQGMGTTVVAALLEPPSAHVASVGDSRLYLWREGELARVTSDQTWVNEVGRTLGLTEEQIHNHPFRNVLTMAVGAREGIDVHSHELTLRAGDILLLCSDGLHGVVPEQDLAAALGAGRGLAETAAQLIAFARERGGPDNITAVLVQELD
jgi:serine/threonine protein phosphatase PrpC